ncbi:DUF3568 family protein [Poriferisphaera sp. WC338]|uniref:DUF3568 family protein n=1 Tax=Poriferisphaera sp. WC338 TaxID=3425129 RepID=UPI003D812A67
MRRYAMVVVLVGVTLCSSGCIALALAGIAGAASMGMAYAMGEYEGHVAANPPQVTDAAGDVLRHMDAKIEDEVSSWKYGRIDGELPGGEEIRIRVEKESDDMSNLSIRVGVFGNEPQSTAIYNQIKVRLEESEANAG